MERIQVYSNLENIAEVFSLDRNTDTFYGLKCLLSRESKIIFCDSEENVLKFPLFEHLAKDLTEGNFLIDFLNSEEDYLLPPFKTNLQEKLKEKGSLFFSNDNDRVDSCSKNNGILMSGIGGEISVYNKLNFNKEIFRANRILTFGTDFNNYSDLEPYVLPFSEIIINEPYLFMPEQRDFNLEKYLQHNFKPLFDIIFNKVSNKTNIVICTYINEQHKEGSDWYDREKESFSPLYDYIKGYFKEKLGGARFKLWLIVSPMARKARHDRYIITNYQYFESGAGLTFFDDRGKFINRGEAIHLYSIMHDDVRKTLMPSIISKIQEMVINKIKEDCPNRIFGKEQGDSYYLSFS